MASITQRFLVPVSTVSARNAWHNDPPPPPLPPSFVYSYFEKGCRKKCTLKSRKVLWVVSSALIFKEIWKNGTGGHGHMFASAKGKQQKYACSTATVVRNSVLMISHITFRDCRVHIFSDSLSRNSCIKYYETARGGGGWGFFQRNWVGNVRHVSWNHPISDQNLWFLLPYFRPNQKFDTLFQIWIPGARRVNA